jgi:hypothetical protein
VVTQSDLMLAILALDAYNRGDNPGMNFNRNSDAPGTLIGGATILSDDDTDPAQAASFQAASFYAIAYTWNGQTIISYRGTRFDGDYGPNGQDFFQGWTLGVGFSAAAQPQMALSFYQDVASEYGAVSVLTGHSLGGALAGFVADLTGTPADIFNNIPYGAGVVVESILTGTPYDTANIRQFVIAHPLRSETHVVRSSGAPWRVRIVSGSLTRRSSAAGPTRRRAPARRRRLEAVVPVRVRPAQDFQ